MQITKQPTPAPPSRVRAQRRPGARVAPGNPGRRCALARLGVFVFCGCMCLLLSACASQPHIQASPNPDAVGLSRTQAQTHQRAAWQRYRNSEEAQRLRDMLDANLIVVGDDAMPISSQLLWNPNTLQPDAGYPVFISLHGGGAFTPGENNEQWDIQQRRYPAVQGLYICPRSPRDTWDHWHETHMFTLIDTLIRALLLRDDVDPDRIYLLGYCSGGNGVYQLGPILADRWAAVSATKAIHEGAPLANLRNCPIDIQWGEADPDTLDRPGLNRQNVNTLYALHQGDRNGYTFREIEHWRQGRFVNDKSTVGWLARHTRNPYPDRVVWEQNGDVRQSSNPIQHQFYYLAINETEQFDAARPSRITAQIDRDTNTLHLQVTGYNEIKLRLNDHMLNLDQPITITLNGQTAFTGPVTRQQKTQTQTLQERGDPRYIFPVELTLSVPAEIQ